MTSTEHDELRTKSERSQRKALSKHGVDYGDPSNYEPALPVERQPVKMIDMRLERHYRPGTDEFKVIGHTQPEIRKKDSTGREVVLQHEEWKAGEAMPGAIPGAGYKDKIWAGTVVSLPVEEAKAVQRARIGVPHLA